MTLSDPSQVSCRDALRHAQAALDAATSQLEDKIRKLRVEARPTIEGLREAIRLLELMRDAEQSTESPWARNRYAVTKLEERRREEDAKAKTAAIQAAKQADLAARQALRAAAKNADLTEDDNLALRWMAPRTRSIFMGTPWHRLKSPPPSTGTVTPEWAQQWLQCHARAGQVFKHQDVIRWLVSENPRLLLAVGTIAPATLFPEVHRKGHLFGYLASVQPRAFSPYTLELAQRSALNLRQTLDWLAPLVQRASC